MFKLLVLITLLEAVSSFSGAHTTELVSGEGRSDHYNNAQPTLLLKAIGKKHFSLAEVVSGLQSCTITTVSHIKLYEASWFSG